MPALAITSQSRVAVNQEGDHRCSQTTVTFNPKGAAKGKFLDIDFHKDKLDLAPVTRHQNVACAGHSGQGEIQPHQQGSQNVSTG